MTEELESLPLGFRFRPTDEELVNHYLKSKISGGGSPDVHVIPEVDVTRCEPWDLPGRSLIKSDDQEWFFFAPKDRKYPNGHRSNRATAEGYWKATGKDRIIRSRSKDNNNQIIIIGIKKTLVFHRGRAPHGIRTAWIMHEYRTTEPEFESGSQGGYVLYRLFNKEEERTTCVKDENETAEIITSSSVVDKPIESQQPTEDLKEELQCSVSSSIVIPSTFNQGLKEIQEDGIMQLPKLQLDEEEDYTFPCMTSPLRPYTDHPFPNSLNQEDYMKLLHANNFSNPELDADSNEAMYCWPYEQLENKDADYPNDEINNVTTTIEEDTGINILDRGMNLPTDEIPGPLQGNAKRRIRLLINEFCGSSCMMNNRNENNKVLQHAGGGNGSLAGKHDLPISGTDSGEISGFKAEEILKDKLISKGKHQHKGFLCTIGNSARFALCVILIFVCFGLWRKSAGGIRW